MQLSFFISLPNSGSLYTCLFKYQPDLQRRGKIIKSNRSITIASHEHVEAIRQIYRLVQISPAHFLELAELSSDQPIPAKLSKSLGGFISPPDERDMQLTLENGLVFVCVEGGEVVAFNRYITQADKVYQELCKEFNIDQSQREFSHNSFTDWSGHQLRQAGKSLTQVHWIDREQALLAFNAALAALENKPSGRLAWSVDAAVHPGKRSGGIPKAFMDRANSELNARFGFRCFRIFEILKINDKKISIENTRSKSAFINAFCKQFAYTEEEVVINNDITLLVRWNYWLKQT